MGVSRKMHRKMTRDKQLRKMKDATDIAQKLLDKEKQRIEKEISEKVKGDTIVEAMWALHITFGFGAERLKKFFRELFIFSNQVVDERINTTEVLDELSEKMKLDLASFMKNYHETDEKELKKRRDFLSTYRFGRMITKADQQEQMEEG